MDERPDENVGGDGHARGDGREPRPVPPHLTPWEPGESGNPSGPPVTRVSVRAARKFLERVRAHGEENLIVLMDDGSRRTTPRVQHLVETLWTKAFDKHLDPHLQFKYQKLLVDMLAPDMRDRGAVAHIVVLDPNVHTERATNFIDQMRSIAGDRPMTPAIVLEALQADARRRLPGSDNQASE